MTQSAADSRNGSTLGAETWRILLRWDGLVSSFVSIWGRANSLNKDRLEAGLPEIDLKGIIKPPVSHRGVLTTMSNLLGVGELHLSPYPGSEKVVPAVIIDAYIPQVVEG